MNHTREGIGLIQQLVGQVEGEQWEGRGRSKCGKETQNHTDLKCRRQWLEKHALYKVPIVSSTN
jgi:hypothetical protein